MEKRVVIAVILSIAVLYGYSLIFPPVKKMESVKPAPATQGQAVPIQGVAVQSPSAPAIGQVTATARDIVVETDLYTAVFSSKG